MGQVWSPNSAQRTSGSPVCRSETSGGLNTGRGAVSPIDPQNCLLKTDILDDTYFIERLRARKFALSVNSRTESFCGVEMESRR